VLFVVKSIVSPNEIYKTTIIQRNHCRFALPVVVGWTPIGHEWVVPQPMTDVILVGRIGDRFVTNCDDIDEGDREKIYDKQTDHDWGEPRYGNWTRDAEVKQSHLSGSVER
jgi:hypothetical protein